MSVRKRTWRSARTGKVNERWIVDLRWRHPNGRLERIRPKSPFNNKRAAEQYERQVRQSLLDGTYGKKEVKTPTLEEFKEEFLRDYATANNKPAEVETKRIAFRVHLVPFFGKLKLDEISVRPIERFKAKALEDGLKAKTVNNLLSVLRRTLAVAVEWGLLSHVPTFKWLKVPDPEFDFLLFEEAERLLEAAQRELEWRSMIIVALKAGLRLGELLALQWDDVDLEAKRITVRRNISRKVIGTPKSGRTRSIDIGDVAVATLRAHRHLRGDWVFCDADGAMLTKGGSKWPLWRLCRRAGLRRIGWHVLRHTFASHLVMRGVPIKVVQEMMGHATIEMTMRYAHLSPDTKREAAQLLDAKGTKWAQSPVTEVQEPAEIENC